MIGCVLGTTIVEANPLKKKADERANPLPPNTVYGFAAKKPEPNFVGFIPNPVEEKKPDTADQKVADDIQHHQTNIETGICAAVDAILALSYIDKRLSNEAAAHCKAEVDIVLKIINQRRADRAQSYLAVRHFQPMMGSF